MMVLLMRGIPGSGKSTEAKRWASLVTGTPIFSVDNYMYEGGRAFNPFLLERCHEQCRADFKKALEARTPLVIIDNTNTKLSSLMPYIQLIEQQGYGFTVVQFHVKPSDVLERNTHDVPLPTLERMAQHMWSERLPSEWHVWSHGTPWRPKTPRADKGRPKMVDALTQVLGQETLSSSEIVKRLEEKGWLPSVSKPMPYIAYVLSDNPEVFDRVRPGHYRIASK
jgi:predicted kinase